jgi:hypothetical protein
MMLRFVEDQWVVVQICGTRTCVSGAMRCRQAASIVSQIAGTVSS